MQVRFLTLPLIQAVALWAQTPVILDVDVINTTACYYDNFADVAKFGTSQSVLTAAASPNFNFFMNFGDVVAVNGEPVKEI